jgi:hypothetical protein
MGWRSGQSKPRRTRAQNGRTTRDQPRSPNHRPTRWIPGRTHPTTRTTTSTDPIHLSRRPLLRMPCRFIGQPHGLVCDLERVSSDPKRVDQGKRDGRCGEIHGVAVVPRCRRVNVTLGDDRVPSVYRRMIPLHCETTPPAPRIEQAQRGQEVARRSWWKGDRQRRVEGVGQCCEGLESVGEDTWCGGPEEAVHDR